MTIFIFTIGTYAVNSLTIGWCGSVCGQTKEKKAVTISMVSMIMNSSFVWTPSLWPKSHASRYAPTMASSAALSISTAALAYGVKVVLKRRNAKLRSSEDEITVIYVY